MSEVYVKGARSDDPIDNNSAGPLSVLASFSLLFWHFWFSLIAAGSCFQQKNKKGSSKNPLYTTCPAPSSTKKVNK